MSKRYVLREGLDMAMIPGVGRVNRSMHLTGDYGAYCPSLLVEILDSMSPPPPPARVLTEPRLETSTPAPEAAPAPEPELLTETLPVEDDKSLVEEKPKKKAPRKRRRLFSGDE